jgi:hypothetical protein
MEKNIDAFITHLKVSLEQQTFVKLSLSKPQGQKELSHVYARLVAIKNKPCLQFTYRFSQRDEAKNLDYTEGVVFIQNQLPTVFRQAHLQTTTQDLSLFFNKKGENPQLLVKNKKKTAHGTPLVGEATAVAAHDFEKKRLLDPRQAYFQALDITDTKGQITPTGQKKFKQIDKYIDIIAALLREMPLDTDARIADFGSGKGYLTFALYDYLTNRLKMTPSVSGYELREKLVSFCNDLAQQNQFENLHFFAKDINEVALDKLDMLIALHACDIATDVAIAKGIKSGAKLIVVAPCCHKQVRKELHVENPMAGVLKHGILAERQAELLTDGLRALLLEAHGYRTKVFEFVGTEHTPKNVMIVGIRTGKKKAEALAQVSAIKAQFGIGQHYLETLI